MRSLVPEVGPIQLEPMWTLCGPRWTHGPSADWGISLLHILLANHILFPLVAFVLDGFGWRTGAEG